jgi:phosphate starvation-inducible protein PhoH
VVRHPLVARIVEAYDADQSAKPATSPNTSPDTRQA